MPQRPAAGLDAATRIAELKSAVVAALPRSRAGNRRFPRRRASSEGNP